MNGDNIVSEMINQIDSVCNDDWSGDWSHNWSGDWPHESWSNDAWSSENATRGA